MTASTRSLLVWGVAVLTPQLSIAQPVTAERVARLREQARPHWDEYRRHVPAFQAEIKVEGSTVRGGRVTPAPPSTTYIKQAPGCSLLLRTGDKTSRAVVAANPDYCFYATSTDPEKGWLLNSYKLTRTAALLPLAPKGVDVAVGELLLGPISFRQTPLETFLSQDEYELTGISETKEAVRIAFRPRGAPPKSATPRPRVLEGWIDVSPPDGWLVKRLHTKEVDGVYTGEGELEYTYRTTERGIRTPARIAAQLAFAESGSEVVSENRGVTTLNVTVGPEPAVSEFMLSSLGLPEPVGIQREQPTRRYLWFVAAAGALAAIAIGFRYLARRRTPKPTVPA